MSGLPIRPIIPPRPRHEIEYGGQSFIGHGNVIDDAVDQAVGFFNEWFTYQPKYSGDGTPCHTFTSSLLYDGGALYPWIYVLFVSGPIRVEGEPATGQTVRLR